MRRLRACCIVGSAGGHGHRSAWPLPCQAESRESSRDSKLRRVVIRRENPCAGYHGRESQAFTRISIGHYPANESAERDQRIARTRSALTGVGHLKSASCSRRIADFACAGQVAPPA